jgi:Zn finger protein HypA/HybF involved in hydrogenase expression
VHEFSLAQSLMQQVSDLAAKHQASSVLRVCVAVGEMSGIVIDSFQFGFEILSKEQELTKEAVLDIENVGGGDLMLTQVEME